MPQPYYDSGRGSTYEPYFRSTADGAANWHPISQLPFIEPRILSCTVSVLELDDWGWQWLEFTAEESEPDTPSAAAWGVAPAAVAAKHPDEAGRPFLLKCCCGFERPWGKEDVRL